MLGKNWDPFLTFGIQSFKMTAFFSICDKNGNHQACPETARLAKCSSGQT
jgi:hypothetical protein